MSYATFDIAPIQNAVAKEEIADFDFGQWVQRLRKNRRLSRQLVADKATLAGFALSQQYVHFIENGRAVNIGSDKIQALAVGLGIPLGVLQQALFHKKPPSFKLTGRAAAGQVGTPNSDEYGEWIPYELEEDDTLYYVEIMGDSMMPKISHGDIALVQPVYYPSNAELLDVIKNGHVYLVQERKHGHRTCKYVIEDIEAPGSYWLLAENQALFPKTRLDERFKVLGEVIEVRKTLSLSCPVLKH